MRNPIRNPLPLILAFLLGFYLATTGAAPLIRHELTKILHAFASLR